MSEDSQAKSITELTPTEVSRFEHFRSLVESELATEESFLRYGVPTFHLKHQHNLKSAFLKLHRRLDSEGFVPILRRKEGKLVLQIVSKPPAKPSCLTVNIILFLATIATLLITGYLQSEILWKYKLLSDPFIGAALFTGALMAIIATHEMGHKLTAAKHGIQATYPYFIPGPPPFGTFGAIIQQKSLPPNRDALFDLGASGPILGFIVAIIVTAIGLLHSYPISFSEAEAMGATFIPMPIVFLLFSFVIWPSLSQGEVILLHPMAVAGWIGILVTMLNLMPIGMLDGGHTVRGSLGERARNILSFVAILTLIILGYYLFALIAFFLSLQRHPGPLDDVTKLSRSRKFVAIVLVGVFILCLPESLLGHLLYLLRLFT
jgi:membrane-associated protease RseP (regulator of RpoE activity)